MSGSGYYSKIHLTRLSNPKSLIVRSFYNCKRRQLSVSFATRHTGKTVGTRKSELEEAVIHVKTMRSSKIEPILYPAGPIGAPDGLEDRDPHEVEVCSDKRPRQNG